ncbi:MAG TPA: glycosyl hydrolase [Bryobacteraceae bacterium]|nr:glycosyl hydrolase [Bryobacteraceae bacterium]
MKRFGSPLALAFLALSAGVALAAPPANIADLKRAFEKPPDDARIMVRWWWFGPSVTKPELEREMRAMKEGGIGGFEVQPTYPLEVDNPAKGFRNFQYLSPEFLDDLTFAGEKARELGLRMDLTLGSGWPFGGPQTPITLAAGRLRVDRVPVPANTASIPIPAIGEGEKFIAAFLARGTGRQFAPEGIRRITDLDAATVRVPAEAAEGRVVLFFISSRTKMTVKRPAVGAEGWVLDHYDLAAIQNHLAKVGEPMLRALAKTPPWAVFSDSLEVGSSDWTPNFLDEFRKRRGYDLTPYLPALAGDMGDVTAAIRHDWGQTLSELADENYLAPITQWAKQHGTRFRSQTYGTPPVTLSSYRMVDLPEGEGTQWRRFSATRWAASASHLLGNPITSSETWTWLHSPVFRATPLDMKAEADLHFLQGVNQLIAHGFPYSPPEAGEPGWRFYAAAVFDSHNPWWLVMPDVTMYLQRVSYLLRQGQPDNDVAVYLPTQDAFAHFTLGRDSVNQSMDGLIGTTVIPQILDAGYNFDFIDDGTIAHSGVPYKILILPSVERMPLATLQKIDEYQRKGGTVIATRRAPSLAPGLTDAETVTPKIRELARNLTVLADETKLGATLHARLAADVATAPEIGFVHRKLDFADVYFVANTSNHPVRTPAAFRIQGLEAAWYDPMTGQIAKAGGPRIDLDLAPYESRVVVFSKDRLAEPPKPSGAAPAPVDISTDWKVTFPGAEPITMATLRSWTDDESRKYFSGQVTYEKSVTVADSKGRQVYLNLGEGTPVNAQERRSGSGMRAMLENAVREAAVVYVNGKRAGAVWCAPYEVNITALVHPGENAIRVVVANTALNLLAKGPLPDYKELTAKYGERFQAQDMAQVVPLPSGILGPVRLMSR